MNILKNMVHDQIINFIDDIYILNNNTFNINNYKNTPLFFYIHSDLIYKLFDYIKDCIIRIFVKHSDIDKDNEFYLYINKYLIDYMVPDIEILKNCILYDYDNLSNEEINYIFNNMYDIIKSG